MASAQATKVPKDTKYYLARTRTLAGLKAQVKLIKELKSDVNRKVLVVRDRVLTNYWNEFQQSIVDTEATCNGQIKEAEVFYTENESIEEEYYTSKIRLSELAGDENNDDPNQTVDMSFTNAPFNPRSSSAAKEEPSRRTRLPDIKIEKKSGQHQDWPQFKELFTSMMKRDSLDECEKMYYLQNALSQEPRRLIKHLSISEDSFKNAWEILMKWYDNQKQIIYSQYDSSFSMKKLQMESGLVLREMMTKIVECEYAFKSLKKDM